MTLILGWRSVDAITVFADAQETVGDHRVAVKKLTSHCNDNLSVLVAGSGPAPLVESFTIILERGLRGRQVATLDEFLALAEASLICLHETDVRLQPGKNKSVRFIVAAHCSSTKEYDAWYSRNVRFQSIKEFEIPGWDEPIYRTLAQRLYTPDPGSGYALICGAYLFRLGQETSNYVGGPISAAVVEPNGMVMINETDMKSFDDIILKKIRTS